MPVSLGDGCPQALRTETRTAGMGPPRLRIGSRFQPIIGLSHRRVVGHEALLVAADMAGQKITPGTALESRGSRAERIALEQSVLSGHVRAYRHGRPAEDNWLFLNFSTFFLVECADGPSYLAQILDRHGIPGRQIVIEVLESEISDPVGFIESLRGYRELGCLVAIDDFGSGHSNFDRVCDIAPDMVKLDRRLISRAGVSHRGTHLLTRITQTLHEMGSLVLAEGIETEAEAMAIMDAEADMAQGFYFARPRPSAPEHEGLKPGIDGLWESYYAYHKAQTDQTRHILQRYSSTMTHTAAKLASGFGFTSRTLSYMQHLPGVMRLYLLDAAGSQISQNLCAPECGSLDMRYKPLHDIHGATWYRRDYYRSAIAQPGHVHITQPYLSLCGSRSCVTLSICFRSEDSIQVLCADIEWNRVKPSCELRTNYVQDA